MNSEINSNNNSRALTVVHDCILTEYSSSEGEKSNPKPTEEHLCYNILLTQKHVVRKKQYRIDLISDILALPAKDYLSAEVATNKTVTTWYQVYSSVNRRKSQWTVMMLARALCELDVILKKNAKVVPMDMGDFPPAIQYYHMYMDEIKLAA